MSTGQTSFALLQHVSGSNGNKGDTAVLAQLHAAGSDLTQPTDIVFYLYIPSLDDARAAATVLNSQGYLADVHKPLGRLPNGSYESRYSVVAHIEEAPTPEKIKTARRLYCRLARRYNGEYDGWEAAVVR